MEDVATREYASTCSVPNASGGGSRDHTGERLVAFGGRSARRNPRREPCRGQVLCGARCMSCFMGRRQRGYGEVGLLPTQCKRLKLWLRCEHQHVRAVEFVHGIKPVLEVCVDVFYPQQRLAPRDRWEHRTGTRGRSLVRRGGGYVSSDRATATSSREAMFQQPKGGLRWR